MDKREKDEGPLTSEALARDGWRGDGTFLGKEEAPGHTLPESERDPAGEDDEGDGTAPRSIVPPPD